MTLFIKKLFSDPKKTNKTKETGNSSRNTKATPLFLSSNNLDKEEIEDEWQKTYQNDNYIKIDLSSFNGQLGIEEFLN